MGVPVLCWIVCLQPLPFACILHIFSNGHTCNHGYSLRALGSCLLFLLCSYSALPDGCGSHYLGEELEGEELEGEELEGEEEEGVETALHDSEDDDGVQV